MNSIPPSESLRRFCNIQSLEPNLDRYELFYVWPLAERFGTPRFVRYVPDGQRLTRKVGIGFEPPPDEFTFEVKTGGLLDGSQPELMPCAAKCGRSRCCKCLKANGRCRG